MKFRLTSPFEPTGDQPQAIEQLIEGVEKNEPRSMLAWSDWFW